MTCPRVSGIGQQAGNNEHVLHDVLTTSVRKPLKCISMTYLKTKKLMISKMNDYVLSLIILSVAVSAATGGWKLFYNNNFQFSFNLIFISFIYIKGQHRLINMSGNVLANFQLQYFGEIFGSLLYIPSDHQCQSVI